ncbi:MAG: diacylglycerol kinase family protein [Pedobacter sp.]|nr:diacylglycerol kinase family protein [Pedobacter sp.]MDQ8053614.1 diacylglycerol kinase family protein [Pedobacter sp.]
MRKFLKSFTYAFKGIGYTLRTQQSFQIECAVAIIVVLLGYGLGLSRQEWLWIALSISLVLVLELLNTAIEVLVDLVSPQYHPQAGIVKDVASGAVLIASLFSLVTGLCIFVPKLIGYVA